MLLLSSLAFAGELAMGLDVGAPRTPLLHANDWGEERVPAGNFGAGISANWRWTRNPVSGALVVWTRGTATTWESGTASPLAELGVDVRVSGRPDIGKLELTLEAGGGLEGLYGLNMPSAGLHASAGARLGFPGGLRPWVGLAGEGIAAVQSGYVLQSFPSSSAFVGGLGAGLVWSVGLAI
jgi:hypothetical protein